MEASGSVSDPNNWQARYASGDVPWDKGIPAPPLADFLKAEKIHGHVLVPGCGGGHDVRAIAQAGAQVVGLDFAPKAIEFATSFLRVSNEKYVQADLFHLPAEHRRAYDWVFEHTCFCAIDPSRRGEYVNSVVSALKEGGHLLAIFYLNPEHDREDGPPFGVTPSELDTFFTPHFHLEREWRPKNSFEGRENRELLRLLKKR